MVEGLLDDKGSSCGREEREGRTTWWQIEVDSNSSSGKNEDEGRQAAFRHKKREPDMINCSVEVQD